MEVQDNVDGRTTDMRQRILDTALERFSTVGFAATSLRDLADRLGVTKAALYYHFPRKAQLIDSVLRPMVDDIDAWYDHAEASGLPPDRLLLEYFEVVHRHRDLIAALGREPGELDHADLLERVTQWVERSQRLFAGPEATLEQRIRATVAIAGLARCVTFFPDATVVELRTHAVRAALDALGGDDARPV